MGEAGGVENDLGGVRLPYRGRRVEQIRVDFRLVLMLGQDAEVAIEQPALLSRGPISAPVSAPVRLVPETADIAPALALINVEVLGCEASKAGLLRLAFAPDWHLVVEPHANYEAWTAAGPEQFKCVCTPGGSLAVWR